MTLDELKRLAADLPDPDRRELARFLDTFEGSPPNVESEWKAEAHRRTEAMLAGERVGLPIEEAQRRLRET